MDEAAAKKTIVENLEKKKGKSKFYLKDFYAMFPDEKVREVKKAICLIHILMSRSCLIFARC